jgi:hypothetical protein
MIAEPLSPLEWTRRYGYLYPRSLFRAALVASMPPLMESTIELCWGEWETCNGQWREQAASRSNRRRDARGRFAPAWLTP